VIPPNEQRGFVHKRLFAGAKGFFRGGPIGAVSAFVAPTSTAGGMKSSMRPGSRPPIPATAGRPANSPCWVWGSRQPGVPPRWGWDCTGSSTVPVSSFAPTAGCPPLMKRDPITGQCKFFFGQQPGAEPGGVGGGNAVAGAFGMPAIEPDVQEAIRLSCPTGMVLGRDNLCYPKQVLRRDSRFRKWRPGMRPILTGGERHGITKAKASINKARKAVGLAALK